MFGLEEKTTYQENKLTLSRFYTSKEEFVKEFERLYSEKSKAEEFYLLLLTDLEKAVLEDDIDNLKKLSNLVDHTSALKNPVALRDCCDNTNNPIRSTNLVILASKHNRVKILEYLLDNDHLSIGIGRTAISPADEDETGHNAFYYAIRSRNIPLLDTLINKWPKKYFENHSEELDDILSKAYGELKLRILPLSDEMEVFVENKLINLRFFSSGQDPGPRDDLSKTRDRIELLLQSISLLKRDYSHTDEVDGKFLFVAKSIAQNIHILKRRLKSTYDRLPWEEIEFCLVIFVSSLTKPQEMNLFYRATLNKCKILNYIENFANELGDNVDITKGKLHCLPRGKKRENIVAKIIETSPQFSQLYEDYQRIRDIHSLKKINDHINLALTADPGEKEGQLVITRVLQIIGEHVKNTLESAKLSHTTSELLMLSLPKNTRKIIGDLRDSISHADSLSKRIEIEENEDSFFQNVQNDIKKIGDVITDILYKNKIETIRIFLRKIINSENLEEIREVLVLFSAVELDEEAKEANFKIMEHGRLEKLIKELSDSIAEKTNYEEELFKKMNTILSSVGTPSQNIRFDYIKGFTYLQTFSIALGNRKTDHKLISSIKLHAGKILKTITPKTEAQGLPGIVSLANEIIGSVKSRISQRKLDDLKALIRKIFYIVAFVSGGIKWIEELSEKLNERDLPVLAQRNSCNIIEKETRYNNQLVLKLSELMSLLSKNSSIKKLPSHLQAAVEMLVLDIMSILACSKDTMENNLLFLEDNAPVLHGISLRNYLAHDNIVVDILPCDPSTALISNARKLTQEYPMKIKKKIGKLVSDDPAELKRKYDQGLVIITNQEKMFKTLEEGDLEGLKDCLEQGADVKARSGINSWTTLHFAAKGPSLEVIKFILMDQNLSVKDKNGQTPLHIAAAHGRRDIVEFLVEEAGSHIDDLNNRDKTPLHVAAQNGHADTVEILLKNKANTAIQDRRGFFPLHYAIRNNHVGVAKVLLHQDLNVDINGTMGGFSSLHLAAEDGHLELVDLLLENRADIHSRNDENRTPLHAAVCSSHLQIVKALILKGANVNARDVFDQTALHFAVYDGYYEIADELLKNGACVNATDKSNRTPLHYAAQYGHDDIVKTLLNNNAKVNVFDVQGSTPLHFAVQKKHLKVVTILLNHGADVNAKNHKNSTPLHYAAGYGPKDIVAILLENKADVNAKANDDLTALHAAVHNSHREVADFLIVNKAEVNARDAQGATPLYLAAINGSTDIIDLLIKNNAEVNIRIRHGMTPLHEATICGHKTTVEFLIKNKAEVNATDDNGSTPLLFAVVQGHEDIVNLLTDNKAHRDVTLLHTAVQAGHKEIVKILIKNQADINAKSDDLTPLCCAAKSNHKDIVELLLANGADVNVECRKGSQCLTFAVVAGYADIVETLLKNKADVNSKACKYGTPLHVAAGLGHKKTVKTLITFGAEVDAISTNNNLTPLLAAAHEGHEEVVEILLASGADVNIKSNEESTPLHMAARKGHSNVVKVLLGGEVNINAKNKENKTPLQLAVTGGHLEVVKLLLQYKKANMNDTMDDDDVTLLPFASLGGNLELVKYLIDEGYDLGSEDPGALNLTMLHYAAMNGNLEMVNFLTARGDDVNVSSIIGLTPLHCATFFGSMDVVKALLAHGAVYNAVDTINRTPLELASKKDVIDLLASTKMLFEAAKSNSSSEVQSCIQAGAFINAKNVENLTPLHYAARNGYDRVVAVLLQNKANPNVVSSNGFTPLHYAAQFSHLNVVKALLSNYAIYNSLSDDGQTPSDLTADDSITILFKLVSESFEKVKHGHLEVIDDLNRIKDVDTVKSILCAHNRENKTLVVAAMQGNFPKVEQLKGVSQGDVSAQIREASGFLKLDKHQKALSIFESVLEKRKAILGSDNPGTFDLQMHIVKVLFAQGANQEASNILEEVLQKQKTMLGWNDKDTLSTRSLIGLLLCIQEKYVEAFNVCREVYQKQNEIMGPNHPDTLGTQFYLAQVLHKQEKYEEALRISRAMFEKLSEISGPNHTSTLQAQGEIATVLAKQGNHEEALKIYEEVLKREKFVFGIDHSRTTMTLHGIAGVLFDQKKYHESLKVYQEVLKNRKNVFGPNHPDTLTTQYGLGNVLYVQRKFFAALKAYRDCFDQLRVVFGPNHPSVLDILKNTARLKLFFEFEGSEPLEILQHLQKDINIAAGKGDVKTVQRLLEDGADVNDKDVDGITPLHYAISNGHVDVVKFLLKHQADVTQVTDKGNTTLHTATSKNNKEIAEVLLQHVSRNKLNGFINAKTNGSGVTALHVAAKNGFLDIIKSLLKQGAMYDLTDNEGKKPLEFSKDQDVIRLLKQIEELFEDAKYGNVEIISKLKTMEQYELVAAINSCDKSKYTLLEVAAANGHKHIACKLLEMMKNPNENVNNILKLR